MTANTTDVYSGNLRPNDSDEIDIRRYILTLLKWWREILTVAILAGLVAGGMIVLMNNRETPQYSASADIVIARLMSNIELDERVNTSIGAGQGDQNGWRASLLQLAKGSDVANAVVQELYDELPESYRSPEQLISAISASIPLSPDERVSSNLIRITATTTDSELSAKITNSWIRHLVDYINGLYGEVPQSMIDSVTTERDAAFAAYQASENSYEEFVGNNQIDTLTRQIGEKTGLRDQIMGNYTRLLTSVISTEYNAQLDLYNTLANAPVTHASALIQAQSLGNLKSLDSLYSLRTAAIAQLNQARNMESTLSNGGEAAAKSNVPALQMLKLSIFATMQNTGTLPANIALNGSPQGSEMTLDEQLTDVQSLVTMLEGYVSQLEEDIEVAANSSMIGADLAVIGGLEGETTATPSTQGVSEVSAPIVTAQELLNQTPTALDATQNNAHEQLLATLDADILTLQAQLAAQTAQQQQLIHQRDVAWTTYDTVGNKLQELKLLRSSANSEVRVGNPALVPNAPQPKMSPVLPVAMITLIAFFTAAILALVIDSLGGSPFFARRTA